MCFNVRKFGTPQPSESSVFGRLLGAKVWREKSGMKKKTLRREWCTECGVVYCYLCYNNSYMFVMLPIFSIIMFVYGVRSEKIFLSLRL